MRNRQALSLRLMAWKVEQIARFGCAGCAIAIPYASAYEIAHTPTGAQRKAHDLRTGRNINPTDLPRVAGISWDDIHFEVTHYARVLCSNCHRVETAIQQGHAGIFTDIDALRAFASECEELRDTFATLSEWAEWCADYLRDCE
jgi:hypothetical protein